MKNRIMAVVALAIATAACSSNKPEQKQEEPVARPAPPPEPQQEVAKDDIEQALIKLHRVHFSLDSSTLHTEARQALGEAGTLLKKHEDISIYVEGNSDGRGTAEYNVALSERRARTVVDYLKSMGIAEARLSMVPKGDSDMLEVGSSQQAHASNRRVDFRLKRGAVELVLQDGVRYDDSGHVLH